MSWKPRSLAGRVALSVAFGSLLSGTVVAVVTGILSSRMAHTQEDNDLRDAAGMLVFALQNKHYDPPLAAADQTQEQAHAGIVVAVFDHDGSYEDGDFVAGHPEIPFVPAGECTDVGIARICAAPAGPWVAIAARDRSHTREHAELSTRAAVIAVLLTSLLSTGIALALAHAAVRPLETLARAVQRVTTQASGEVELGPAAGVKEVDALRSTLQSALERLGRALTQARHFAGDAAHQLRQPLVTISHELDAALAIPGLEGREERLRARRVAERLSTLVDRLLILAGPETTVPGASEVSLHAIVNDALETLPDAARRRIEYQPTALRVLADPALLVSALTSALENALKFSSGAVRIHVTSHEQLALVAVEDDGPGVADRERDQVFAPFFRGREGRTGHVPGHGIGLAVIARVTAVHGGTARFAPCASGARLEMTFALAQA
ncbi:MAG: HAMP domain-containing sensor histidine kinase [Polyangiales bacterium]